MLLIAADVSLNRVFALMNRLESRGILEPLAMEWG
jgi:hypothetical protein